jgi:hypothetical protein
MAKSIERRCRTSSMNVCYALHLYSSGMSLRQASERLSIVIIQKKAIYLNLELDSTIQAKEDISI